MATTYHFLADNGDMTLLELDSGRRVQIDVNVRAAADNPDDPAPDVAAQLRKRLVRDEAGRLFVDAFLLTHPDEDHCRGLISHFHLGPLADWCEEDDKIVIREMWSSPIVFRRASKKLALCEDACAWRREAKRRVAVHKDGSGGEGDRILILGKDTGGRTDDIGEIVVEAGELIPTIDAAVDGTCEVRLLAPLPTEEDEEEDLLTKNNSSVVIQFGIDGEKTRNAARYLLGGDAQVGIWEKIWARYGATPKALEYDVLLAPHHCSWHSLSWLSWSDMGEQAAVSPDARSALGQALRGAVVLSSSKVIADDDSDPPCVRAKREYESIVAAVKGEFRCLADDKGEGPVELQITSDGPRRKIVEAAAVVSSGLGKEVFAHG